MFHVKHYPLQSAPQTAPPLWEPVSLFQTATHMFHMKPYHQLTRAYTPDTSEEVRAVSLPPCGKSCTTLSPSSFSMQTRFAGLCMEYERFCSFRLDGLRHICGSKSKNHSEIQSRQVQSSFAGAEMRSGNEKHAADTCCLGKGFEAAWKHFRPSKPCVSLSTDGTQNRFIE